MVGINKSPVRNFEGEQLKLLFTFKLLFEERSVVKTAERTHTTQSAVSKQLKKLREWFNDDLFVRTAHGMEPTERALQLIHRIEDIIEQLESLNDAGIFKVERLNGYAVIQTSDEVSRTITPALLRKFRLQAPNLGLRVEPLEYQYAIRDLEAGRVDLVISVNWHAPDQLLQKRLFSDEFVVVMNKTHPLANKDMSNRDYADAQHLLVAPLSKQRGHLDSLLEQEGYSRRIHLRVPTFGEITSEIMGDEYIVTLPSQVAKRLSKTTPLCIKPLPFGTVRFSYYMFWHRRFINNQRNQWIRSTVGEIYGLHMQ